MTQASADGKSRVLVVDDNLANLTVLGDLLEAEYEVQIASSGTRALQLAARTPQPELILLDLMMPDMDGYEVMLQLGADPRTQNIPVIFVSAHDHAEDRRRALAIGAVDYIAKPFVIAEVRRRVREHIALHRTRASTGGS